MARMLAIWNSGDAEGLDRMMNEGLQNNPEARRILLGSRNEKWAEWIDDRMGRPGTVFMAVGAGHLTGTDSVQVFLQQRGISSARVPSGGGAGGVGAGSTNVRYPPCRGNVQDRCTQRGGS